MQVARILFHGCLAIQLEYYAWILERILRYLDTQLGLVTHYRKQPYLLVEYNKKCSF